MIPGPFDYHAPRSLAEAIGLLGAHGFDAKLLAGGQSLIPMMKFRLAEPAVIVDLNRVPGLDGVREQDGQLVIGALAREADLEQAAVVATTYPILLDTALVVADPLVRNLATVGGNLAHADPANDHPATMLALGAELTATGPTGERTIPIDDFFVDTFTTALEPDEILTAIRIPRPAPRSGGAYVKFERKVGDYAIAGAAAHLTLDDDGRVAAVRIGLTNVNYKPMRATQAEAALLGQEPTEDAIRAAAQLASQECDPSSDLRGPADYKRAVARTVTARALRRALERARAA
ncbi:MAG: xanthine dehydrogenase family protein subunit M [Sphaerobacter sp.]|nr:xanthine dehydrogenase family protein subunit M [Sphaerobacter sp.]